MGYTFILAENNFLIVIVSLLIKWLAKSIW
jgi:hypothetical protein